jgi:hypothetical protein
MNNLQLRQVPVAKTGSGRLEAFFLRSLAFPSRALRSTKEPGYDKKQPKLQWSHQRGVEVRDFRAVALQRSLREHQLSYVYETRRPEEVL